MRSILAKTAHLNTKRVKVVRMEAKQKPDNHRTGTIAPRVMTDGNVWHE
jgi:membrane protein CcdC involved in cytochrome C biogenesis